MLPRFNWCHSLARPIHKFHWVRRKVSHSGQTSQPHKTRVLPVGPPAVPLAGSKAATVWPSLNPQHRTQAEWMNHNSGSDTSPYRQPALWNPAQLSPTSAGHVPLKCVCEFLNYIPQVETPQSNISNLRWFNLKHVKLCYGILLFLFWLCRVLVAAHGILDEVCGLSSCGARA